MLVRSRRSTSEENAPPTRAVSGTILAAIAMFLAAAAWLFVLGPRDFGGPLALVWVSGESMEPTMYTGDLAVMYRSSSYDEGDIVAFEIPEGGIVIHRVIDVVGDGTYRFQGDNRRGADPWLLPDDDIIGRRVVLVPKAAHALGYLARPATMGIVATLLVLVLFAQRPAAKPDVDRRGEAEPA